ncbi:N-acetylmuramoyl-L-alanine amidase [Cytobacillus purgationiresistens]|uniref:N-acetylmuramoyl-L-alanine amidase n=1 Tax=Cytobacillus purgationiresistens TaxID=863449 RepID=A0ABU0ADK0_9BACI|nr:N-acetylmuramoyl-L-alanine amidase [Cytobacillus purgationiresistens]MDQ0269130.1 N-acetylmuramoyl-L-alanine amidase [Cytobacillus purgationiresistens]
MKNVIKFSFAVFIFMLMLLQQQPSDLAEAASEGKNGILTQTANIYMGPGKSFGISTDIRKDSLVTTYQTVNGWTYTVGSYSQGWVWGEFIQPAEGVGIVSNVGANVYTYSGDYLADNALKQSSSFVMFNEEKDWRNVSVGGRTGRIWGEFATKSPGIGTINIPQVNLYNGAGKTTGIKVRLSEGKEVKLTELKNGWRHIYTEDQEGWIWDEFISKTPYTAVYEGMLINPLKANVYHTSGKSGGIKGQIYSLNEREVPVRVFQHKNGWKYVRGLNWGGGNGVDRFIEGWVWGEYITPVVSYNIPMGYPDSPIFADADASSEIIGSMKFIALIGAYEKRNGFKRVKSGDLTGWVPLESLSKNFSGEDAEGVVTTRSNVNVYRGPGKSYSTIGSIPKDSDVNYYNLHNGWRYVDAGYTRGWVWGEYVDPNKALTIFIDPGHGGADSGASGYGLQEKDAVLNIALKARAMINRYSPYPINIKLTRSTDSNDLTANGKNISPEESLRLRTEFAKNHQSTDKDIFISLHTYSGDGKESGGESNYPSALAAQTADSRAEDSKLLAESIHARLIEFTPFEDRGVEGTDDYVLTENVMPAALIQMGNIENEKDNYYISDKYDYGRSQAAKAIYQGTLDYLEKKGYDMDKKE